MKFSIPYNGHNDLIKRVREKFGSEIHEVYLAPDKRISATGRSNDGYNKKNSETLDQYTQKIEGLMKFCEKVGMEVNILFNPSFINFDVYSQEGYEQLEQYITSLYTDCYITGVTIIDPYLIPLIKKSRDLHWKDLKIHASVNLYADSVNRVKILESLGVDNICLDRDINRNLKRLNRIRKNSNVALKLLVNEGCLWGCPFRKFHHERKEVYSGGTESLLDLRKSLVERYEQPVSTDLAFCLDEYKNNPWQLFRSPFVRPEDLHYYTDLVDIFKIAGREMDSDRLEQIITAYVTNAYEGNLLRLIFRFHENLPYFINNASMPDNFHKRMTSCQQNCKTCGYCHSLTKLITPRDDYQRGDWVVPDKSENWYQLGRDYLELGRYEKAIDCFQSVMASHELHSKSESLISVCKNKLESP